MKNKSLKNRLNDEIEKITPRVYDVVISSSYIEKAENPAPLKKRTNKTFKIALSAVACVLVLAIAITCGIVFTPKKDNLPTSNYYYVAVSANEAVSAADEADCGAKITLTLNSEEKVETARAENVNGDIILRKIQKDAESLVGKTFDSAMKSIRASAEKLGFVSEDGALTIEVSGENAKEFANGIAARFDFSVTASALSKEQLVNSAKKYFENATSSMSFEQLTAVFAKRQSFLEESWNTDKSVFSEIYYKLATEKIENLKIGSSEYLKDFTKGTYSDMIEELKKIESVCDLLGLSDLKESVKSVRETIEGIDFNYICELYDKYVSSTIDGLLSEHEKK